jgi:uncharacterized protein involved in outer membrane biogenesis
MRFKKILIIIGLIIVTLIAACYVIVSIYDFNKLRPGIAQAVKDATGRELSLDGDIKLKVGFTVGVAAENVSLQNAPWGTRPDMATIKRLEFQFALIPLIKRRIELRQITLVEPDILVEANSSGTSNLTFQPQEGEAARREAGPILLALIFQDVLIRKGIITYRDGRSGSTYVLDLERLAVSASPDDSPIELAATGNFNGAPFELGGTLGTLSALMNPQEMWPVKLKASTQGATLTAQGGIRDIEHAKGLSFDLTSEGRSISDIAKLWGIRAVPDLGPFKLALRLSGGAEKLAVEDMDLHVGTEQLAEIKLNGSIRDLLGLEGMNLDFDVRGRDLANFKELTNQAVFVPGAFNASGRITGSGRRKLEIPELKMVIGKNHIGASLELDLSTRNPRLNVLLSSRKFDLSDLLPPEVAEQTWVKALATMEPIKLAGTVAGFAKELAIELKDFQAGTEKLAELNLKGTIKSPAKKRGIDLDFTLRGDNIANLQELIGQPLPVQGAYAISGVMTASADKNYKVSNLKVTIGDNTLSGWLALKRADTRVQLATELSAQRFNLRPVVIPAMKPLTNIPSLGPLKLAARLSGSGQNWGIEDLDLNLGSEKLVEAKLKGSIKNLLARRGIQVDFSLRSKDLGELKKVGGPDLSVQGPVAVSGKVVDPEANVYKFSDLRVVLGDNDFGGLLELNLNGKRPKILAELSSEKLDIRPAFALAQAADKESAEPRPKQDRVFPDEQLSFEALRAVDATLKIRSKQILLPKLVLDDLAADAVLKDGMLSVEPFRCVIGGGNTQGSFTLSAQGSEPEVSLALEIDELSMGSMLQELGVDPFIEGTLRARLHVDSGGESMAKLMAGLNGEIVYIMSEGRLKNPHVDMLGRNVISQTLNLINPFSKKEQYTEFNCAVNCFHIDAGLARSKAWVLDTKHTKVIGGGTIDLTTERLNLVFGLSSKKGIRIPGLGRLTLSFGKLAKNFKLEGTLAQPSLVVDPKGTAVALGEAVGGMVLFGPFGLAAGLLGVGPDEKNPCQEALESAQRGVQITQPRGAEEIGLSR